MSLGKLSSETAMTEQRISELEDREMAVSRLNKKEKYIY